MVVVIFFLGLSCSLFAQNQLEDDLKGIELLFNFFQRLKKDFREIISIDSWQQKYGDDLNDEQFDLLIFKKLIKVYFCLRQSDFAPQSYCQKEGFEEDVYFIFFVWNKSTELVLASEANDFCLSLMNKWQTLDELTENLMHLFFPSVKMSGRQSPLYS